MEVLHIGRYYNVYESLVYEWHPLVFGVVRIAVPLVMSLFFWLPFASAPVPMCEAGIIRKTKNLNLNLKLLA